ncbi:hypothetical protein KFE25_004229 [Diacronema lutheri]|uniref:R3H domain-containing protein n=2 Tax=Diacronema lutheri TaxID=2081491 RepID=A0A8J5X9B8_DIALT|nr:hypothetical protein KFE25_004229 [Diacronema lutheri]
MKVVAAAQPRAMGVPAFFKWLSTKYPKIVVDVLEEYQRWVDGERVPVDTSQPNPNGIEFDNLFLDMNGIIHPASHPEDRPAPKTEDDMYLCIADYLERVFACVRPRKLLFMAIDGVAPRAKMNQQRSRRFKSDAERREARRVEDDVRAEWEAEGRELPPRAEGFDSNVITPGTPFMHKLALFLRAFICHKQSTDEGWRHLRVILSDASVPGEGEHKIMEYIRQQRALPGYDPNTYHALHGLDADLIMLALATHEPYFCILREYVGKGSREGPKKGAESLEAQIATAQRGEFGEQLDARGAAGAAGGGGGGGAPPTPFQFLHVHVLREYLHREFTESRFCAPEVFNFERLIDDFVFLCFFVGNDFLPHVPSLEIREGAIDTLLDVYRTLFARPGGGYLCDGAQVDLRRVQLLTVEVAALEEGLLRKRRENEQREEGRRAQRLQDVAMRTAERRHLALLAEAAQTPAQIALNGGGGAAAIGVKRSRDEGGGCGLGLGFGCARQSGGSSDDKLLRLFETIKQFATSDDGDGEARSFELPASLSGFERRMAHQYCDELGLEHPTVGQEPNRKIVLSKKGGGRAGGAPAADGSARAGGDFSLELKALLRSNAEVAEPVDAVELGKEGWRERYYSQKLGDGWRDELERMCTEYVRGLCWVMGYYYDGCPSWHWFYPYHYAPFATDLVQAIALEDVSTSFELGTPFRPLEQLMAVLPPGSAHALPPALAALMVDEASPLAPIYPLSFDCDMNGKRFAWQAVVLLPFIDQELLLCAVRAVEHTLSPDERARNALGQTLVFVSEAHPMARPLIQLMDSADAEPAHDDAAGADASGAAEGAPAAAARRRAPARRVQLTMKLSRGMGGAISAVACAPRIGSAYALPPFRGERAQAALQPFETRATYGAYHLPPRAAHRPQLLPGVQLPRSTLSAYDRPSFGRYTPARRQPPSQQLPLHGCGLSAAQLLAHSLPQPPMPPGAMAALGACATARPAQPPRPAGGYGCGLAPQPPPPPQPRSAAHAWLSYQQQQQRQASASCGCRAQPPPGPPPGYAAGGCASAPLGCGCAYGAQPCAYGGAYGGGARAHAAAQPAFQLPAPRPACIAPQCSYQRGSGSGGGGSAPAAGGALGARARPPPGAPPPQLGFGAAQAAGAGFGAACAPRAAGLPAPVPRPPAAPTVGLGLGVGLGVAPAARPRAPGPAAATPSANLAAAALLREQLLMKK